jgi:predicted  nucleic acid-binding Zn-ribbon protein
MKIEMTQTEFTAMLDRFSTEKREHMREVRSLEDRLNEANKVRREAENAKYNAESVKVDLEIEIATLRGKVDAMRKKLDRYEPAITEKEAAE